MDTRHLSPNELAIMRRKVVEAIVIHGLSPKKAAVIFGFSRVSIWKYLKEYEKRKDQSFEYKTRGVKPRTGSKMNPAQEEGLVSAILSHTPDELGMDYTLWNSKVIETFICSHYAIKYHRRSIRKIMNRLGFTSQKPIKQAYERDPQKVEIWLKETYPKIKVKAMQEGGRLYWGDETGIHASDNRGRVYGLKGKTPILKKPGSRFKCNTLAAISPQGYMNWMVFEDSFTSEKLIAFLGRLIRQVKQKVFLILDNHPVHHSRKVRAYVEKHKDKIEIFYLPPYSPDLNPQELVNQDLKANANNFKSLKTVENLAINVRAYLTQIQQNEWKIRSFFKKKEVAYAA
jgi:transposase